MKNVTPITPGDRGSADAGDMRATSSCPSRIGARHGADTPRDVCRRPGNGAPMALPRLGQTIAQRTEGNPLFMLHAVNYLEA